MYCVDGQETHIYSKSNEKTIEGNDTNMFYFRKLILVAVCRMGCTLCMGWGITKNVKDIKQESQSLESIQMRNDHVLNLIATMGIYNSEWIKEKIEKYLRDRLWYQ